MMMNDDNNNNNNNNNNSLIFRMSTRRSRATQFVRSIYESEFDDYYLIHKWMDSQFPEPAWRRKRQPVDERLELKIFTVMAYMCNYDDLLLQYYEKILGMYRERRSSLNIIIDYHHHSSLNIIIIDYHHHHHGTME